MPDFLTAIVRFLQPGLSAFLALTIGAALALGNPFQLRDWLGFTEEWFANYRWAFGLAFIIFAPLSLLVALEKIAPPIWSKVQDANRPRLIRAKFDKLSTREKTVLIWCLDQHSPYFRAPRGSSTVARLIDKGWVMSLGDDRAVLSHPFKIRDAAWTATQAIGEHIRHSVSNDDEEGKKMWGVLTKAQGSQRI
jgi:Super-infection exclusion protein B